MPFLSGRDAHVDASSVDAKFGIRVVQCAGVLMKKIFASLRRWLCIESENGWMKLWT